MCNNVYFMYVYTDMIHFIKITDDFFSLNKVDNKFQGLYPRLRNSQINICWKL